MRRYTKDAAGRPKDSRFKDFLRRRILCRFRDVFCLWCFNDQEVESLDRDGLERLMTELRPRLHRYCGRMVGSTFDGEDVVQEALAKALEALPIAGEIKNPVGWLLRIAHNTALDSLRRRKRQGFAETGDAVLELMDDGSEADARVAAAASFGTFLYLPAIQRSSVLLVDLLGYSLVETADILSMSVAAVKAALHRGRGRLAELVDTPEDAVPSLAVADHKRLRAYADRFNARDFDALRDLLSEEVRLELVTRTRLNGRKDVAAYFTRYSEVATWQVSPGWAEGRPVLLVRDPAVAADDVAYVILLDWAGDRIAAIRDFRYAPYVMEGLTVTALSE
jgi:RNA polymerase sigma-70 factor (ECF subfamily)